MVATGYQSNRGVKNAFVVTLVLNVVLLSVGYDWMLSVRRLAVEGARDEALSRLGAASLALGLGVLALVLAAILFLVWLHRAFRNLPALGSESITMTPKQAVVGWLIPLYNLVHGYQTVRLLYLESQPAPAVLPNGTILPRKAALIGWWWFFFLAKGVGSELATYALKHFPDDAGPYVGVYLAIGLIAAAMCILIVNRIERRQRDQHDDLLRRVPIEPASDLLR